MHFVGNYYFLISTVPTIGFQQLSYTFDEGTSEEVCVTVDQFIEGPSLIAILAYVPLTASKKVRFVNLDCHGNVGATSLCLFHEKQMVYVPEKVRAQNQWICYPSGHEVT